MVKITAWDLLRIYCTLAAVSALVICLSGGRGWLGFAEFVVMNMLILTRLYKPIKEKIVEYISE